MLWSSWWFHRAAINFEALPSSVGMEIFLNLVGCCNVDFEADIMLTYTQRDSNELFPSTKAFQKNPRQWMMVGTSAINKCGWTPNLKDNGNITLIISQTESSNVVYNSQISWLLVSTLVATKGCRCQHFLQWYWFAETTVCARYLAMATMHLAWGMQLQRGIKASNVVEVCWPMIAPGIYQLTQEASRTIHWHPTSNPGQSDFSHHFSKYFRSTKSSTNFWKWCVFHQFWDVSACFYKSFGWQILRQRSQRCACRFWPKRAPGSWALVLRDQRWPSRRSKRARIIIISLFQWPFGFFSTIFRHIHLLDVQKPMDFDSEVRWEGLGDSDSVPIEKRGQLTVFWTQCG